MLEEPQANIKVELSIPPQKILGASQRIMFKYGEIVEEAMQEVASDNTVLSDNTPDIQITNFLNFSPTS